MLDEELIRFTLRNAEFNLKENGYDLDRNRREYDELVEERADLIQTTERCRRDLKLLEGD